MEYNTAKSRFGGIARVYGIDALEKFEHANVLVAGIGGVGSWAAEALVRSGVGKITLVDLDDICVTNTNRQVHTVSQTVGQAKVDVMAGRINSINPDVNVSVVEDFVTPDNVNELFTNQYDAVIDATDSIKAKAAMIARCKRAKIFIVTVGGAGGQIDPTQVQIGDLAKTTQDPLAAKLRNELRRNYGFSKNLQRRFGVPCVYSTEQLRYPQPDGSIGFNKSIPGQSTRLDCSSGFGALMPVTATFGMVAASAVLNRLA